MANMPEVNDLVLIKVKKILPYGAFCTMDEYAGREAFLHISEVAPRWIKNIHEFLNEGQRLVCKVHRIDVEKDQVDISLKRVTETEKKRKVNDARQQRRSAKLFEVALKQAKNTTTEAQDAKRELESQFGDLTGAFEALCEEGAQALEGVKIEKGLAKALVEIAQKSIKKSTATLREILQLASYSPQGVDVVKDVIASLKAPEDCQMDIHYLGAPRYQVTITAKEYKQVQKAFDRLHKTVEQRAKKDPLLVEWEVQAG